MKNKFVSEMYERGLEVLNSKPSTTKGYTVMTFVDKNKNEEKMIFTDSQADTIKTELRKLKIAILNG